MKEGRVFRKMVGRQCQCPTCNEYFNSDTAFDKHRIGTIGKPDRRCLTPDEMLKADMSKNAGDWWVATPFKWGNEASYEAKEATEGDS